jgi:hypothetical protein
MAPDLFGVQQMEVQMSQEALMDEVALRHRPRQRSNGVPPGRAVSLAARDVHAVLSDGWLPSAADLGGEDGIKLDGLEELRVEHQRFVHQADDVRQELRGLEDRFRGEDQAWHAKLEEAYTKGQQPPAKDPRTPEEDRERLLEAKRERLRAAHKVAIDWAQNALHSLREVAPIWLDQVRESQQPLHNELRELNERVDAIKAELRKDSRLEGWLKRIDGAPGTHIPFSRTPQPTEPQQADVLGPLGQIARAQELAARGLPIQQEEPA